MEYINEWEYINECEFLQEAEEIFKMSQYELKEYLKQRMIDAGYKLASGKKDKFLYFKGALPIMLVAHMDTVHKHRVSEIFKSDSGRWTALEGIGGDDRCGVLIILRLIDSGYRPTVLFVEDEEIGCVGSGEFAKKFQKPPMGTKYIIEFDRKGNNDCVFYSCGNPEFTEFIENFGFKTEWGTYSDICEIAPVWKLAAVNLSSGYYNPHTTSEVVDMNDVRTIADRAAEMLRTVDESPRFEYIEEEIRYGGFSYHGQIGFFDSDSGYDSMSLDGYGDYWDVIPAMPLKSGYIITSTADGETGTSVENDDYYMDERGTVYVYDKVIGGLLELENTCACDENGEHIDYDFGKEEDIVVVY